MQLHFWHNVHLKKIKEKKATSLKICISLIFKLLVCCLHFIVALFSLLHPVTWFLFLFHVQNQICNILGLVIAWFMALVNSISFIAMCGVPSCRKQKIPCWAHQISWPKVVGGLEVLPHPPDQPYLETECMLRWLEVAVLMINNFD